MVFIESLWFGNPINTTKRRREKACVGKKACVGLVPRAVGIVSWFIYSIMVYIYYHSLYIVSWFIDSILGRPLHREPVVRQSYKYN